MQHRPQKAPVQLLRGRQPTPGKRESPAAESNHTVEAQPEPGANRPASGKHIVLELGGQTPQD